MVAKQWHYNKRILVNALEEAGLRAGDVVFTHTSLGRLGYPEEGKNIHIACQVLKDAFQEILGEKGTLLVPTYTYSIGRREIFDVQKTPSTVGPFSEFCRQFPGAVRSRDPMLAVTGIGPLSKDLLSELPHTCYGRGSLYERMRTIGAKICNIGLGLYWATFRHHIEEMANVPFRFKKVFTGYICDNNQINFETWLYYAAILIDNCMPYGLRLEKDMHQQGKCKSVPIGRGEIVCVDSQEYFDLGLKALHKDPWYTARGPACDTQDIIELETKKLPEISLTSMLKHSLENIWQNTHSLSYPLLSNNYDYLLAVLGEHVPLTIYEYPTGLEKWGWIVPEKWTCLQGFIQTENHQTIIAYDKNPHCVIPYSQPFSGLINHSELLNHVRIVPNHMDKCLIQPYFYVRDWAFCLTENFVRDVLNSAEYLVGIDTVFTYDTLKIGEIRVTGNSKDCLFISCQIDDKLENVFCGMLVAKELMKYDNLKCNYRFLIISNPLSAIFYVNQNESQFNHLNRTYLMNKLQSDKLGDFLLSYTDETQFTQQCLESFENEYPMMHDIVQINYHNEDKAIMELPILSLEKILVLALKQESENNLMSVNSCSESNYFKDNIHFKSSVILKYILKMEYGL